MLVIHLFHLNQDFKAKSSKRYLEALVKDQAWGSLSFSYEGKPLISNGFVSVTHARNHMVIAYDAQQAIGIDLEYPREISASLIQRLKLDPKNPLLSWCKKEALIKLLDDKTALFKPLDPNILFTQLAQENDAILICASTKPLGKVEHQIIHLSVDA
jgi:hypothetical protein